MGILDASISSGRSTNAAQNYAYNNSQSMSIANAIQAQQFSAQQAALAYERQKELQQMQMDFNRDEAQKSRDWETQMANSIYTRSIANMKQAGINPILAANMGLSGANVGSGATASISGASAPMAQSFMGSTSTSTSSGESFGESRGSSWSNSQSGLATFLETMGAWVEGMIGALNSSKTIDIAINGLDELFKDDNGKTPTQNYDEYSNTEETGKYSEYRNQMKQNNKEAVGENKLLKFLNGLQLKATGLK